MRKVILNVAVSLDGFIEGPNGEYDWCFTDQDYGLSEFYDRIDAAFIGRKSYELLRGMEEKGEYSLPKLEEYVFSNTLEKVKEGSVLVSGDIENQVSKIKQEEGKDIWLFGGASLTTSMMNLGMVDELQLAVHPIVLGKGTPLFRDLLNRFQLSLEDTKTYDSGLVILKYSVLK
jgi:dihydrofolate reductase